MGYAEQAEQLGTGHALLQARRLLQNTDNLVVLTGDVPLVNPGTIQRMIALHDEREACITMVTSRLTSPDGLGRIVRSSNGRIAAIVEERDADEETLKDIWRLAVEGSPVTQTVRHSNEVETDFEIVGG